MPSATITASIVSAMWRSERSISRLTVERAMPRTSTSEILMKCGRSDITVSRFEWRVPTSSIATPKPIAV